MYTCIALFVFSQKFSIIILILEENKHKLNKSLVLVNLMNVLQRNRKIRYNFWWDLVSHGNLSYVAWRLELLETMNYKYSTVEFTAESRFKEMQYLKEK